MAFGKTIIIMFYLMKVQILKSLNHEYLKDIHYFCLVMSKKYIENHFADIKNYANAIEQRIDDSWCTLDSTLADNAYSMEMCKKHNCNYILIDEKYQVEPYL